MSLIDRNFPPSMSDAIISLYPGSSFSISEDQGNYNIQWIDTNRPMPDMMVLKAELARLKSEWDAAEYRRLRVVEYPPMNELADALYWQGQGDQTAMNAYLAKVAEVKAKYPKP